MASKRDPQLVVRLFLVRHGETVSNTEEKVAGQAESPLTAHGEKQALALGGCGQIEPDGFWLLYASDLQRAQETTRLILKGSRTAHSGKDSPSGGVREYQLDKRLRELSKGARQGYHKTMSNEEAILARREEMEVQGKEFNEEDLPVIESEQEGFHRFSLWLFELVREALLKYSNATTTTELTYPYKTLVVSHSALLRAVLMNMFSKEELKTNGAVFNSPTHLIVPNTALTILDIIPNMVSVSWQSPSPPSLLEMNGELWKTKLVELNWTGHYNAISKGDGETANSEL